MSPQRLPIDEVLPALLHVLRARSVAVLEAAPGAGKTTRVPLALLDEAWLEGKRIIMLEPRRLAARNAATWMARQLGERVGETVGYRVRGESRVGKSTRIEIVTEGVLARMRASDPGLLDFGIVIFDEFHERSLHADLSLALVLQTQELLRPELRVLVMSATLDGVAVAALLRDVNGDAPVVRSSGRMFPVETHYRPPKRDERLEASVSRAVREAVAETDGDLLVFLPGAAEQRRVAQTLSALPDSVDLYTLHGTQSFAEQERAIAPSPAGRRKVVLTTSVAETSLTIEGVRTVVDSGLSRIPRYSARTGLTRLDTVRVSRASADQRRGRAGRVASGWCYRLWDAHEDAMLAPRTRPEILDADLSQLALELAESGVVGAHELRWLDMPPDGALASARELLRQLDAIDSTGAITSHGRRMLVLPVAPRLAHMLVVADRKGQAAVASIIAALLDERDIVTGPRHEAPSDLRLRIEAVARFVRDAGKLASSAQVAHESGSRVRDASDLHLQIAHDGLSRVRENANDLQRRVFDNTSGKAAVRAEDVAHTGPLVALAWPDRIAQRRPGNVARFVLRNGSGAQLAAHDALASSAYLAIAALDGAPPEHRIALAAPIALEEIRELFGSQIESRDIVEWDEGANAVRAWRREQLGALVLAEQRVERPSPEAVRHTMVSMLRRIGADAWPWTDRAQRLRERLAFIAAHDATWPDASSDALIASIDEWSVELLDGVRTWKSLKEADWSSMLLSRLTWTQRAQLDELAPTHIDVPSGSRIPIDYSDATAPVFAVRLQEVFGWADTPRLLDGRVSLTLHLLSPAHRPVQVTRDLAGFWKHSYFEVRKDMRGRYPRHPWPDDPLLAPATRRAKPRGT